jgi:hypothetical protein
MLTSQWMPKITLRNFSCYYTYFSFTLFLFALFLPCNHLLRNAILINSIGVGIVGNLIVIRAAASKAPSWALELGISAEEKAYRTREDENKLINNFTVHTLPMVISLLLLMRCNTLTYSDSILIYVCGLMFMLIWSIFPYQNRIGGVKMIHAYPGWSVKELLAGSLILVMITVIVVYAKSSQNSLLNI